MGIEELFDLGHRHLLPAAIDHVLDPARDAHVSLRVNPREVAGAVVAVVGQRLGGQLGPVEVALESPRGSHLEVSFVAGR